MAIAACIICTKKDITLPETNNIALYVYFAVEEAE